MAFLVASTQGAAELLRHPLSCSAVLAQLQLWMLPYTADTNNLCILLWALTDAICECGLAYYLLATMLNQRLTDMKTHTDPLCHMWRKKKPHISLFGQMHCYSAYKIFFPWDMYCAPWTLMFCSSQEPLERFFNCWFNRGCALGRCRRWAQYWAAPRVRWCGVLKFSEPQEKSLCNILSTSLLTQVHLENRR